MCTMFGYEVLQKKVKAFLLSEILFGLKSVHDYSDLFSLLLPPPPLLSPKYQHPEVFSARQLSFLGTYGMLVN